MAIELQQKFAINLGTVVKNSLVAVQTVRRKEQARKEAEFQRAIADGLSYGEQIALREKQLENAKAEGSPDQDYIANLEKSIADTKKLNRFNTYRSKYAATLGELSGGKINEEQYLETLQSMLKGVDDPDLRLEIQNDISEAEGKVKLYRDTILDNQVKKAKYDGTQSSLKSAIAKVKTARSEAALNDNEDEVTAYDETLAALNAQYSTVKIQDSITDFQVNSATKGVSPLEKLNYINTQAAFSDKDTAIKIGDRTYESAAQFWELERNSFLTGNSQIFGNFFSELQADSKNKIAADAAKFGYPTQPVLDSAIQTFNDLRSKPEIQPFINMLDITQASTMAEAVDKLAKTINDVGTNNLTFKEAQGQLAAITQKYGIDTSAYQLDLDERLRNLARSGIIGEGEAISMAPDVNVKLPNINAAPAVPGGAPVPGAPAPVAPGGGRIVKAGDTLSGIAREAGVTLAQLLDLNPQFRTNPNLIRVGQSVTLPGAAPAPAAPAPAPIAPAPSTPTPAPTPAPKPSTTTTQPTKPVSMVPPTQPTPAPAPVKAPAPAPVQQTPPPATSTYAGNSIVDYLKSVNQDTSFAYRQKVAAEKGITGYTGTAEQNLKLLKTLRGS